MKYLINFKTFETVGFGSDITGIGSDEATFDHSLSPVLKEKVKEYVERLINEQQFKILFNIIGKEAPKNVEAAEMDSMIDQVKDDVIAKLMKQPHKMINLDEIDVTPMMLAPNTSNTDGVPRTNNIGGTSQTNSPRIGQ
jgi:hypothetical protein